MTSESHRCVAELVLAGPKVFVQSKHFLLALVQLAFLTGDSNFHSSQLDLLLHHDLLRFLNRRLQVVDECAGSIEFEVDVHFRLNRFFGSLAHCLQVTLGVTAQEDSHGQSQRQDSDDRFLQHVSNSSFPQGTGLRPG